MTLRAALALFLVTAPSWAEPLDDLLPPPVRPVEKRTLGGDDDRDRARTRYYLNERGGPLGGTFSPDGKLLVTSGYPGIVLWDVGSGKPVGTITLNQFGGREGAAVAFTPDGKHLVGASWGGSDMNPVGLYDVAKRTRVRSLDEDANDMPFVALSVAPNGKTVALAPGFSRRNEALEVALWDVATGDEIGKLGGLLAAPAAGRGPAAFQALAHSPDGRTLAVLTEGKVILVELATGRPRGEFTWATNTTEARQFDPRMLRFQEVGGLRLGAVAFTADGLHLAIGCSDGAIRRFDLRTGKQLPPLPGHSGPVVALCYTPEGKYLHSYGLDGQFCAWRAEAGRAWKPKAGPLPEAALDSLWDSLRSDDPLDLYGCLEALGSSPAEAVRFLAARLAPVPAQNNERIEQLIADVLKRDYNTRKKAAAELRKVGAAAVPALRKALERGGGDGGELLRRIAYELDSLLPIAEQNRQARTLAVLERIGTDTARQVVEKVAGGAADADLTVQAKAVLERMKKAAPAKEEFAPDALWAGLANEDPITAYRAVRALAIRPAAVAKMVQQLQDVTVQDTFNDDPKRVAQLLKDLDSDDFNARDDAEKALRTLGRLVVPALRKTLEGKPSAEVKKKLEELLDEATKGGPPAEMLRLTRAVEALEMMAGPESKRALATLAQAQNHSLAEAAAAALKRRERQP